MADKTKKVIIVAAFVLLAAAIGICVVLLLKKNEPSTDTDVLDRAIVTEDNVDQISQELSKNNADAMFECKMTTSWTFDDGKSVSRNAYVANAEGNQYTICFDVYEKAANKLLYSSPMIPVGKDLTGIKLDSELPQGQYDAVVMYRMVDENNKEVSSVGFDIVITVNS